VSDKIEVMEIGFNFKKLDSRTIRLLTALGTSTNTEVTIRFEISNIGTALKEIA